MRTRLLCISLDLVHQPQAGILGLHHHVEQDQGDARIGQQHAGRFGAAVGVEQFKRAGFVLNVGKCQPGGMMNVRLIIDDQHLPGVDRLGHHGLIVIQLDDVVIQPELVLVLGTAHIVHASRRCMRVLTVCTIRQ